MFVLDSCELPGTHVASEEEHTHGTWRIFDQPGSQRYRGVAEVLRGVRLSGLRRGCRAGLADLEERRSLIGLFHGMFEKNMLTFNPGWDQNAQKLAAFTDIRDLQRQLKAQGIQLAQETDESTTGPASFIAIDPDGNPILFDQHV